MVAMGSRPTLSKKPAIRSGTGLVGTNSAALAAA